MLTKSTLAAVLARLTGPGFQVKWWDGDVRRYGGNEPSFSLNFHAEPAFNAEDPMVSLGEAYMDGVLDFDGDWNAMLGLINSNRQILDGPLARVAGVARTLDRLRLRARQKENIAHHYDIGNDFYRMWLDPDMNYSCAYFATADMTLEQAQQAKIDHILAKLCLKPGERLLDVGCGWGALLIRAAQRHGICGVGLTLSAEQAAAGRARLAEAGLSDRVEIRQMDYLDLSGASDRFDKAVSVGMYEHVGERHAARYFARVADVLEPGGLFLLHTIVGHTDDGNTNRWVEKYIFPGGEIPYLPRLVDTAAKTGFFLLTQESLRLHYAATLAHWRANFDRHLDAVRARFDERFVRMWTLYLRGSEASFRGGGLDLGQFLFSRGLAAHPPRHQAHLYNGGEPVLW